MAWQPGSLLAARREEKNSSACYWPYGTIEHISSSRSRTQSVKPIMCPGKSELGLTYPIYVKFYWSIGKTPFFHNFDRF